MLAIQIEIAGRARLYVLSGSPIKGLSGEEGPSSELTVTTVQTVGDIVPPPPLSADQESNGLPTDY